MPLTLLSIVVLGACSAHSGVAVGPSDKSGIPTAYVTRCVNERIISVRLVQLGADQKELVLWRIDANAGQPLDEVVAGDQPPGFNLVVAPHLPLPQDANLDLIVESSVADNAFFRLRDLRPGRVDWEGRQVSLKDFHNGAYYGGKCAGQPIPRWIRWAMFAILGLFITAPVVIATLFVILRVGRRHPQNNG